MLPKGHERSDSCDYAATGFMDGTRICTDIRDVECKRRNLILKAARGLCSDADNTVRYLDGLEAGMQKAGTMRATARRLRYEAAVIISSYGLSVEVESPGTLKNGDGESAICKERLDARSLESQNTWLGLVNTARRMRSAAADRRRIQEGLPRTVGRGNHTIRRFHDNKFDKLREQLIERTGPDQALDLLDAAIIAVFNAYSDLAQIEIDVLRQAEQRIHDLVNERKFTNGAAQPGLVARPLRPVAQVRL